MINFSNKEKTNPYLLTKEEAKIFCIFLYQENLRHEQDIINGERLIEEVESNFRFNTEQEYKKVLRCKPDCLIIVKNLPKCRGCHYD